MAGERGAGDARGEVIDDDVRSDNRFVLCRSVLISNIQTGRYTFFLFRFTLSGAISRALLHGSCTHHRARLHDQAFFFSVLCSRFVVGTRGAAATPRNPLIRPHRHAPSRTEPHRAAPRRYKCDCFWFWRYVISEWHWRVTCCVFPTHFSFPNMLLCEEMCIEQVNMLNIKLNRSIVIF